MTEPKDRQPGPEADGRALWRRYRRGAAPATAGETDAGLIAAYLDGGLSAAEREAVEAWLAATPGAFDVLVAARAALGAEAGPAPAAVAARAAALVGHWEEPARRWRRPALVRGFAEWATVAAAVTLAAYLGFAFGLESAAPATEIEIALGEPAAVELWAPDGTPFDPFGGTVLDPAAFVEEDPS